MPIVDQEGWDEAVKKNDDSYGKCAVDTARRVMEILDEEEGDFNCHEIICRGDEKSNLTGFLAGCVASMVGKYHSRGEEFRIVWNKEHGVEEDKAKGGTVNPAILTIGKEGE